jgi:acetyl esterase
MAAWHRERNSAPGAADHSVEGMRRGSQASSELARKLLADRPRPAREYESQLCGVPVRVLHPESDDALPTVVYFHGGGWVTGGTGVQLHQARRLCVEVDAVVVSVGFRLAPENPFPAAFDDCLAATKAVIEDVDSFGGEADRVALCGDSAGGQLAASVAIALRDEHIPLAAQALVVPITDTRGDYADPTENQRYPSRRRYADGYGLTLPAMVDYARHYAPRGLDWRASPLLGNLAGVAPAVVHTAGFDVLRDEGIAYVERLSEAGVPVIHRDWPTLGHAFFGLGGVSAAAERAAHTLSEDLRYLLGGR